MEAKELKTCKICGCLMDVWFSFDWLDNGEGEWQCPNQEMHIDDANYQGE